MIFCICDDSDNIVKSTFDCDSIVGSFWLYILEYLLFDLINTNDTLLYQNDINKIIFSGFGASGAINHLVHLIKPKLEKSVVFVTIYEHYSNYLPWLHYASKLEIIDTNDDKLIDEKLLE